MKWIFFKYNLCNAHDAPQTVIIRILLYLCSPDFYSLTAYLGENEKKIVGKINFEQENANILLMQLAP